MLNFFKSKKNKNIIPNELRELWNFESFKNNDRCFHYGNFPLFRLLNEEELNSANSKSNPYLEGELEKDIKNKTIIAISDTNADREHDAYLLCDNDFKIYGIKIIHRNNKIFEISSSFRKLLNQYNIKEELISRKDNDYLAWSETCFHSYDYIKPIKGVFPKKDLRELIKDIKTIFYSHHNEFSFEKFSEYLKQFDKESLLEQGFSAFRKEDESLAELLKELNKTENSFKVSELFPYGGWFIINLEKTNNEEIKQLISYGVINNFA